LFAAFLADALSREVEIGGRKMNRAASIKTRPRAVMPMSDQFRDGGASCPVGHDNLQAGTVAVVLRRRAPGRLPVGGRDAAAADDPRRAEPAHVTRDPIAEADVIVARAFADLAALSIAQHRAGAEAQRLNEQLSAALSSRGVIEQAKGVI
jgi:GAF domain-containing protein